MWEISEELKGRSAQAEERATRPFFPWTRRTKIIATLGPASESPDMIRLLIERGVNVFRFNMSHAGHAWVREKCALIREIAFELDRCVGLLMDTQGPAIRTGDLQHDVALRPGDMFTFTVGGVDSSASPSVSVNYEDLPKDITQGDIILVDNGVIRMKVLEKSDTFLRCEVLTPGVMGSRRHINLPGVRIRLPALTDKDLADVALGIECGMDFFALSFVREPEDIQKLREFLASKGAEAMVISKIEDRLAVENLFSIIDVSDAVMVARGDLGIECPYEELPIIQRRIVKTCIAQLKPVIVATHLLESMVQNPVPTRAEITDIANAVYEQADALLLSSETAAGRYPADCVSVLDRVAVRTERSGGAGYEKLFEPANDHERLASAAVHLANQTRSHGICVFTRSGYLAAVVAGLRPRYSSIFVFSPDEGLCRRLTLYYGIRAFQMEFPKRPEETVLAAEARLLHRGVVRSGQKLVFLSSARVGDELLESILLHEIR
ncbi:pyruvate kinase [Candidatus Methylacidithermus pantelleriae]|uniref:Pyruvate kinase n=1 Tax=Candidatus Methylacidithermus pantelleriae TaxID=2744239 RepID=A0A8J2BJQ7_9BACT|nr:pyruvate kinase [Candidatus Methylacidithermus pantelleriae]CAF0698047.1 Pyruvate kinase [Candidatus Methylacidithermus pantelleriae]